MDKNAEIIIAIISLCGTIISTIGGIIIAKINKTGGADNKPSKHINYFYIFAILFCLSFIIFLAIDISSTKSPVDRKTHSSLNSSHNSSAVSSMSSAPMENILESIRFNPGGGIEFKQDANLFLNASSGWIWASLPKEIDINRYNKLIIDYKSGNDCTVYLEIKNKNGAVESPLVADTLNNNVQKIKLDLPGTHGKPDRLTLNLSDYFIRGITNRLARIIAFSDPDGDVEIMNISFIE
jgi:hypothetical protein